MKTVSFIFVLFSLSVSVSESSKWEAHQVEGNVEYTYDNKTMFPLRFKTVDGGGAINKTCTTFFYDDSEGKLRSGQLLWSEDNWDVELYACTPVNKLSTIGNGDKFTNVPEGPERIWEVSWDLTTFTVKCNEVEVWKYQFADHLPEFPDETCGQIHGGLYGPLKTFLFNTFEFGEKKKFLHGIFRLNTIAISMHPGADTERAKMGKSLKRRRIGTNGIK